MTKKHIQMVSEVPKNSTCLLVLTFGARFVIVQSHEKNLKKKVREKTLEEYE